MNAPYDGKFRVTQEYKGPSVHDGLDLVGIDSKNVRCVVKGTVIKSGWENPSNKKQGFGIRVCIKDSNNRWWYYGHLSSTTLKVGQTVKVHDVVGIEGNTGYSTGSHCHICCRPNGEKAKAVNVATLLSIPNKLGTYTDGYVESKTNTTSTTTNTTTSNTNTTAYKVGDVVSIKKGSTYYNSSSKIPDWVCELKWKITSVNKDRIVLGKDSTSKYNINSAVNSKDLTLVNSTTIKVGDFVSVTKAVTYDNKSFKVYESKYKVLEIKNDRVVISADGKNITTAINIQNIKKV